MKKIIVLPMKGTVLLLFAVILIISTFALNIRNTYNRLQYGVPQGVYLGEILMEKKLQAEVTAIVEKESLIFLKRPRNAFLDPLTGQLIREVYGEKIDVRATVDMIMHGTPNTVYSPVIIPLEPEITVDIYRNITERKGSFATWYGNGGRAENIKLAAASINNYLLAPGEIFSFNQVTGHSKPGRGYQLAPIIVGNTVIPGYGGGVCQVSTTLYNAVLFADLEVVERFPHSRPVGYVPIGRDATVSDHLDFKFRNNTNKHILIKGAGGGYCVYFEIWSSP
ncbi:MAG: VanW family protein [Bacillota bacterium]